MVVVGKVDDGVNLELGWMAGGNQLGPPAVMNRRAALVRVRAGKEEKVLIMEAGCRAKWDGGEAKGRSQTRDGGGGGCISSTWPASLREGQPLAESS